jgi:hypothetical protein
MESIMRIDVMKYGKAESRHPHKEILGCLVQSIEFDGVVPIQPSVPRNLIVGKSDRHDHLKKFSVPKLEAALDDLLDADVVEERCDVRTGMRTLGVRELLEAADAPYEALTEQVYSKATAAGLWPRWRPDRGWRLVDLGDQIVFEGPMESLNEYLDQQASHTGRDSR